MESRIITYLKENHAEPCTLEQMEHRKLMNSRKNFTLKLESRLKPKPVSEVPEGGTSKSANVAVGMGQPAGVKGNNDFESGFD